MLDVTMADVFDGMYSLATRVAEEDENHESDEV